MKNKNTINKRLFFKSKEKKGLKPIFFESIEIKILQEMKGVRN